MKRLQLEAKQQRQILCYEDVIVRELQSISGCCSLAERLVGPRWRVIMIYGSTAR